MSVSLEQGFLHDVLCVFAISKDPVNPLVHRNCVSSAQFAKRSPVRGSRRREQLFFRCLPIVDHGSVQRVRCQPCLTVPLMQFHGRDPIVPPIFSTRYTAIPFGDHNLLQSEGGLYVRISRPCAIQSAPIGGGT